jgi:RHS repeat-associated protein
LILEKCTTQDLTPSFCDNDSLLTGVKNTALGINLTLTRNAQNGLLTGTALGSLTDSYSYNGFGEVTGYLAKYATADLYQTDVSRDKLGRITQKIETVGGSTSTFDYAYDVAGRLVEVKLNGAVQSSYGYDDNGNRTDLNGAPVAHYDAQDRLLDYNNATYDYTANGELKTKTVGSATTGYHYDVLGNLRQVTLPGGTVLDYVIDGQNRRIGKKRNHVLEQGFLYQDSLKPIAELDGNNQVVSRFVYATGANVPDFMIKGGVTYRLIKDHLGSPRLVVDIATNTVIQQMNYDVWGKVIQDTNPGFQPFGFAGGLYDRDTGLVRFGARDYDAGTGRWTAKDPIGFGGGDTNLYGYVLGDPINWIDLLGFVNTDPTSPFGPWGGPGGMAGGGSSIGAGVGSIRICPKLSGKNPPINQSRQKLHTDGTKGKSQFKDGVDVDNIVEDAWRNGEPQFNSKGEFIGKVKQYDSEVGTQGQKSIDVRFNGSLGIHGFPSNKVE